jgi:hypothetical protein
VSQAQRIGRERIRRLIGECTRPSSLFVTQPYRSHGSHSVKRWRPNAGHPPVFYRIDAAKAEKVHEKSQTPTAKRRCSKMPEAADLFPPAKIL